MWFTSYFYFIGFICFIVKKILSETLYLNDILEKEEVTPLNFHCYCKLLLPKRGKKNGTEKKEHCITIDTTIPNSV